MGMGVLDQPVSAARLVLATYATTKAKPVLWPLITTGAFRPMVVEAGGAQEALRNRREKEGPRRFSLLVYEPVPKNLRRALEKSDA